MRVGVIIPAFNAADWIGRAIGSVLAQTHGDWVLAVVDDGSTDATSAIVEGFADPRLSLIRQPNSGVSAARNRGAAALDSDALLFLDADDRLAPNALSRLVAALEAEGRAVAAVGPHAFLDHGNARRPATGDILESLLVRNCFANGGQLLLRRSAVRAAGGFLSDLIFGEDWEYWVRIALQGPFAAAPGNTPVLFVSQHPDGAYRRLVKDPAAFVPCMEAIFANPALPARLGLSRLTAIRTRAEAENDWIIGRELIRNGQRAEGRSWLRRSVIAAPSLRRLVLLTASHALPLVPLQLRGPLRPYPNPVSSRVSP